jgi:hypothetical protein
MKQAIALSRPPLSRELKSQIGGDQRQLQMAQERIHRLNDQTAELLELSAQAGTIPSSRDLIFLDIIA